MHEAQMARAGLTNDEILAAATALLEGERNGVANMANLAGLLAHSMEGFNWLGFYVLRDGELVVGPFQGKPACVRIAVGTGVCGTSIAKDETIVVDDVHDFPGHIACDADSRSEIVVPFRCGETRALLDVDSPRPKRFGPAERSLFEEICRRLSAGSDAGTF